jgi:hypothetical protein
LPPIRWIGANVCSGDAATLIVREATDRWPSVTPPQFRPWYADSASDHRVSANSLSSFARARSIAWRKLRGRIGKASRADPSRTRVSLRRLSMSSRPMLAYTGVTTLNQSPEMRGVARGTRITVRRRPT